MSEQGGSSYGGGSRINEWVKQNNTLGELRQVEVPPIISCNVVEKDRTILSSNQSLLSRESLRPFPCWTPNQASCTAVDNVPLACRPLPATVIPDRTSFNTRPQGTPHPAATHNSVFPAMVSGQYHSLNNQQLVARQAYRRSCQHSRGVPKSGQSSYRRSITPR